MDQVSARLKLNSLAEYAGISGSEEEALAEFDGLTHLVKDAEGLQEVSLVASLLFNEDNGIFMSLRASIAAHGECCLAQSEQWRWSISPCEALP